MEIMHMIYRDANTGKIWEQIGGQEPRELKEEDLKIWNINVDTIPVIGNEKTKKIICPNCGTAVPESTFCPECGERLDNK